MESLAFQFDKRVINVPYVMYGDSNHSSKIANSKGLNKEDKQNYAYCYLGVLSEENNEKKNGHALSYKSRFFRVLIRKKFVKNRCRKKVLLCLTASQ